MQEQDTLRDASYVERQTIKNGRGVQFEEVEEEDYHQRQDYYSPNDIEVQGKLMAGSSMLFSSNGRPVMHPSGDPFGEHAITGIRLYEKRCRHHLIEDHPDNVECTFKPRLMRPLGAPKDGLQTVDPLMFQPIITIKHSPMTKSSIDYHYKRLIQARKGPQVYREKPSMAGGGPFYQKIACEGSSADPVPKSRIGARKKKLIDE